MKDGWQAKPASRQAASDEARPLEGLQVAEISSKSDIRPQMDVSSTAL